MKTFKLKRINDKPSDFLYLFKLRKLATAYKGNICLDFSECDFLRPNAVAYLGALYDEINAGNNSCSVDWGSAPQKVIVNLQQNGFYHHIDSSIKPWDGNSIRFRKDDLNKLNFENLISYLREHCLGRHYLDISEVRKNEIVSNLLEVYINATNHSITAPSIYTCGQFYPGFNILKLTVLDFGVGIPYNVKKYLQKSNLLDAHAISQAFEKGFSTTNQPGGNGLPQLYEFVKEHTGRLEVYSGKGVTIGTKSGLELYKHNTTFKGTLVQMTLKCDIFYS